MILYTQFYIFGSYCYHLFCKSLSYVLNTVYIVLHLQSLAERN